MSRTLLESLATLAGFRLADRPAAAAYQAVVDAAVGLVTGAGAVMLSLGLPEKLRVMAVAGVPDVGTLDGVVEPACQAAASGAPVRAGGDLSGWPRLAASAGSAGVVDLLAEPLDLGGRRQGALSFFTTAGTFDGEDVVAAATFAVQAAAVVANAAAFDDLRRSNDQLNEGIRSRETIGLAKGILMRQELCSETEAFQILAAASQRLNRKVRDVASDLIAVTEGRVELERRSRG